MAQNSARNTLKKNRARLTYLRNLILVSNVRKKLEGCVLVFELFVSGILCYSANDTQAPLVQCGTVLCNTLVAVCYYSLYEVSKPVFSKGKVASLRAPTHLANEKIGELLDGGYDILGKGWVEYCHDIIYICCFAQFLCTLSNKFWFILLLVSS
eukprot:jgi/Galph1/1372/GphlegSOOS_G6121.1